MSRRNKVNPDHYTLAGRLAPDDMARELRKQAERMFSGSRGPRRKPMPPWMAQEQSSPEKATLDEAAPPESTPVEPERDDVLEEPRAPRKRATERKTVRKRLARKPARAATGRRKGSRNTKPAVAKASRARGTSSARKAAKRPARTKHATARKSTRVASAKARPVKRGRTAKSTKR